MRGDEEVKKTLNDEGGWSFSWVNPGHDEHNLNLLLILILVVNIFPVGKYLKFRKVMRLKICIHLSHKLSGQEIVIKSIGFSNTVFPRDSL